MEIGSAYALQVCLLQIPVMVAFSLWFNWGKEELADYTFRYKINYKHIIYEALLNQSRIYWIVSYFLDGM